MWLNLRQLWQKFFLSDKIGVTFDVCKIALQSFLSSLVPLPEIYPHGLLTVTVLHEALVLSSSEHPRPIVAPTLLILLYGLGLASSAASPNPTLSSTSDG